MAAWLVLPLVYLVVLNWLGPAGQRQSLQWVWALLFVAAIVAEVIAVAVNVLQMRHFSKRGCNIVVHVCNGSTTKEVVPVRDRNFQRILWLATGLRDRVPEKFQCHVTIKDWWFEGNHTHPNLAAETFPILGADPMPVEPAGANPAQTPVAPEVEARQGAGP